MNLLYRTSIQSVSQTTAAGQTTVTTNIVDMSGWDDLLFVVQWGTNTTTAAVSMQLKANSANSTSGMANVGAASTFVDAGGATSNLVSLIEFYRPLSTQRYVELAIARTVANSTILSVTATLFKFKASTAAAGPVIGVANLASSAIILGQ
ncbi:MAG: hypothetical protein KGI71_05825 [Patescibacteria group bacterium]|nr:hypothetical protein [Patescibacteria group bacterium]